MDLSVIIISWNVRGDLAACLDSVRTALGDLAAQVIVIDNASADGSPDTVARDFPEVELVRNDHNAGFAAANVQGMALATGRYLLLLNPDTLVPPGALAQLVAFADQNPRAGVVGPKLIYGDGRLQHSCRCFPTIAAAVFRNTWLGSLLRRARASACYLMEDWDHASVREVDWLSGACMLVRREAYEQVGTLDAGFYWGSEDVDYCWRMHKVGWQVLYTPTPVITHLVGRSTDQAVVRTIIRRHKAMYRLYCKHLARGPLARLLIWPGVWARAALLIIQYAALLACGRLRNAFRRPAAAPKPVAP